MRNTTSCSIEIHTGEGRETAAIAIEGSSGALRRLCRSAWFRSSTRTTGAPLVGRLLFPSLLRPLLLAAAAAAPQHPQHHRPTLSLSLTHKHADPTRIDPLKPVLSLDLSLSTSTSRCTYHQERIGSSVFVGADRISIDLSISRSIIVLPPTSYRPTVVPRGTPQQHLSCFESAACEEASESW